MRGDRLMRIGIVLLVAGIVCTLIAILPLVISDLSLPSFWWGLSMLTALGLAFILTGLRQSSRTRRSVKPLG